MFLKVARAKGLLLSDAEAEQVKPAEGIDFQEAEQ